MVAYGSLYFLRTSALAEKYTEDNFSCPNADDSAGEWLMRILSLLNLKMLNFKTYLFNTFHAYLDL